ncbi:MAG: lysophospholipid acyltransferase family protein [Betaproteobacteria bacterium]|nr:lysophospholipid acyltransferase family protein [Betaproteobacteria bacterium]
MLKPLVKLLRETDVNAFLAATEGTEGFEFVERVLDRFNATYTVTGREIERLPADGRLVLLADRAPGLVEAAILLKLARQVRADVRMVANDKLLGLSGLRPLLVPQEAIRAALEKEEAVIAGSPEELPADLDAPVLRVSVGGWRPARFYGLAAFLRHDVAVPVRIRAVAAAERPAPGKARPKLLGLRAAPMPIAAPEDRAQVRRELQRGEVLGATGDGKKIILFDATPDSAVVRELGRLREVAFRRVGEGTGKRRDIDAYDAYYRHVVLWDDADLQIAGAYRLGEAAKLVAARGPAALYTSTLFSYCPTLEDRFPEALELGRSFVQPRYQGLRALDYLWQGIGAYLLAHPEIRYLFGPVSLSAAYPERARRMIVFFFRRHFGTQEEVASARFPYAVPAAEEAALDALFPGHDYAGELRVLKKELEPLRVPVPILYKQYSELCEEGGTRFLAFNVDPAFSYCVDGLVWVDLRKVKAAKRSRYMSQGKAAATLGDQSAARKSA